MKTTKFLLLIIASMLSYYSYAQLTVLVSSGLGYGGYNQELLFDQVNIAAEGCNAMVTSIPVLPAPGDVVNKDVLIISAPDTDFPSDLNDEIINLLNSGGVLFVVGEHGSGFQAYNMRIDAALLEIGSTITNVNNIFNTQCDGGDGPISIVPNNSCIMEDVTFWKTQAMSNLNEGDGNVLLEAGGLPGFVEEKVGNGLVYYISDINWLMPPACPENSEQSLIMLENMICGCVKPPDCTFSVDVEYESGDTASEGCEEVCITFNLFSPLDSTGTSITLGTSEDTEAIEGEDFPILIDEVFIPEGETSVELCFTPEADNLMEGTEEAIFVTFDPCNPDSMIFFSVFIEDVDPFEVSISGTETGCTGQEACIVLDISGGVQDYSIEWSTGDVDVDSICLTIEDTYEFSVLVSDQCGNIDTLTWEIISDCCEDPIILYGLNDCDASPGETAVYNEFTAEAVCNLDCASIQTGFIFREPANSNRHSCTPGVVDVAMCVSAMDGCEYMAGNQASIVFEVTISPESGSAVQLDKFSFFEQAPLMFQWIGGDSGPNNFPTLYGVRVIKDGIDIYNEVDIATTNDWTLEEFVFEDLVIVEECNLRFELLGYCLEGNGALVQAWDIDEVSIFGRCIDDGNFAGEISGFVQSVDNENMADVDFILQRQADEKIWLSQSDMQAQYLFNSIPFQNDYVIFPSYQDDYTNGISTYDLVLIQKHLLGRQPFDSPYQFIAADANGNETVSAADIAILRKLLLGSLDILPVGSWRFVEVNAPITLEQPFLFEENIAFDNYDRDQVNQNFTAVKVGDINASAELQVGDISEIRSDAKILKYHTENSEAQFITHFNVEQALQLEGMQLALKGFVNPQIISQALAISDENFFIKQNEIRMSIVIPSGIELGSEQILFSIISDEAPSKIELAQSMKAELYAPHIYDLELESRANQVSSLTEVRVHPNPFSEATLIRFFLNHDQEVQISLSSATGQIISSYNIDAVKGENQISLDKDDLQAVPGLYYFTLSANDMLNISKIILL